MNVMDDDSSTYCSRHTRLSLSPSQTPERPGTASQHLALVTDCASPHNSKVSEVAEFSAAAATEDEAQRQLDQEDHQTANDISNTKDLAALPEENQASPRPSSHAGQSDTNMQNGALGKWGEGGKNSATLGNAVGCEDEGTNDDDDASSIKFLLFETPSRASGSPTQSSIQFVQNPSALTFREASGSRSQNGAYATHNPHAKDGGNVPALPTGEVREVANDGTDVGGWCLNESRGSEQLAPASTATTTTFKRHTGASHPPSEDGSQQRRHTSYNSSVINNGSGRDPRNGKMTSPSSHTYNGSRNSFFGYGKEQRGSIQDSRSSSSGRLPQRRSTRIGKAHGRLQLSSAPVSTRSSCSERNSVHDEMGLRMQKAVVSPRRGGAPATPRKFTGNSLLRQQHATPLRAAPGTSPALERYKQHRLLESPLRGRHERREELLEMLDEEIEAVRDEVELNDLVMEDAMLRDPFERLYHMNNRRDRDERRCRLLHFMKLEEAKERLLAEDDEEELRRRQRRQESARRREEVFERLYYVTPPRLNNSRQSIPNSGRGGDASGHRSTYIADDGFFHRLYNDAVESMIQKRERMRLAESEREQKAVEELLHSRILARLELKSSPQRLYTPQQMEERATSIRRKLVQSPDRLREFLQENQLTKKKEELLAWRLSRQGRINAAKLAQKKEEMELKECTFHPKTNNRFTLRGAAGVKSHTRSTKASAARQRKDSSDTSQVMSPPRSFSRTQKRACEQLYVKAVKQRERQKALVEEAAKAKKLAFLKSKLKEDHHFRRRVELDPSLAERYMASLAV